VVLIILKALEQMTVVSNLFQLVEFAYLPLPKSYSQLQLTPNEPGIWKNSINEMFLTIN